MSSGSTGFRCSVWTRPNWANLRAWQRGSAGDPRALCQIAEGNPACGDSCHLDPGASRIRLRIPSTPEGARLVRSQNVSPASFFGSPLCFCFYLPGLHFHGPVCSQVLGLLVLFSVFFFSPRLLSLLVPCMAVLTSAPQSLFYSLAYLLGKLLRLLIWGLAGENKGQRMGTVVRGGVN